MGLDMYLTKRTYIGAYYNDEVKGDLNITKNDFPVNVKFNRLESIIERVGYWRKANQIHGWFVENVQDGVDDCRDYLVTQQKLEALLADIDTVLNAKGTPLEEEVVEGTMPSTSGCFFGSTEIDEWYWEELETTKEMITKILAEIQEDATNPSMWADYYYQSSW